MKARSKILVSFLCRFMVIYGLLVAPWPGWKEASAQYLRALGQWALAPDGRRMELTFEPYANRPQSPKDTRVVIVNRKLMAPDGSGPVRNVDLELGRVGTSTMALLLALIFCTPISWRRRAASALAGLMLLQFFIMALLKYYIWMESAEIGLVPLDGWMKTMAVQLGRVFVGQFNVAVPVLIWVAVCFRREDWRALFGSEAGREAENIDAVPDAK